MIIKSLFAAAAIIVLTNSANAELGGVKAPKNGTGWGDPIIERTYDPRVENMTNKYRCFTANAKATPDAEGNNAWCVDNY